MKMEIGDKLRYAGFGLPAPSDMILYNDKYETTLILQDTLEKGRFIEILDFPFPQSMIENGFYYGQLTVTLVSKPILNASQGAEYCQSNLKVMMGTYDNKTQRDITKRNIKNPIGAEGRKNLLGSSLYSSRAKEDTTTPYASERMLVDYGDKFQPIIDASKQLCDRILALYPTQKEAIDRASKSVYRYFAINDGEKATPQWVYPFFDIANYAQLLAKETDDAQLKDISAAMDEAFKEAFVHYRDVNNSVQHLDHYTLSVCLMHRGYYTADYKSVLNPVPENNFNEGYEKCDFHKLTGWGNWLNTNEQSLKSNPECGGGGQL